MATVQSGGSRLAAPQAPPWFNDDWLSGWILCLALVLAYLPVWWAGFVWDDDAHVTSNLCIIGPLGLKEIWTTIAAQYYPLVLTTFWVEYHLWGLWALPYHLVTLGLHGACAIVLWRILRLLQVPGAWLGATIWALHPLQVETVAWITETKNTQSGLFYLLSIFFFIHDLKARETGDRAGDRRNYALTLLFAALAMASKSSTVVLPVVLCLGAWWVEGRWHWRNLLIVAPVFLMSLGAAAMAIITVRGQGVSDLSWAQSWPERLVTSGYAVWFYLGRLLWPHPLVFIYPRWNIEAAEWYAYLPLLAVFIGLLVLWLKRATWGRPWFFALAYFLAAAFPVLGLVNHYFQRYSFVADHLQYLAGIGPLALLGAGLNRLADLTLPHKRWPQAVLCSGLLLTLGVMSWQRAWAYESRETLWRDTLAQNPNCTMAYNNLGYVLLQRGDADEAIIQFQKALEIDPEFVEAHNNLGVIYLIVKQRDRALAEFQKSLKLDPKNVEARADFGLALAENGQFDEAIAQDRQALALNPNMAEVHSNLGLALAQKEQWDEAISEFKEALRLRPDFAEATDSLAKVRELAQQRARPK